jgi:hypothetical protein
MWRVAWLVTVGCGFAHGHASDALGGLGDGSADPDARVDGPTDATFDAPPLPPIMYQQGSGADSMNKTVTVHYPNAQLFRSLNVVFVCWINGNSVASVTDGTGNTYTRAVGPSTNNGMNLSVYYACGVAATATNTVTVTLMNTPTEADVRIVEYSGIAASGCYDTSATANGQAAAEASGAVTTNAAAELLLAGNCTFGHTTLADPTYTDRGIDGFGDIVEDRIVSLAGPYAATATQDSQNDWVMSLLTFIAK